MNFLKEYSNGWGHVAVTFMVFIFATLVVLVSHDAALNGLVISIVTLLVGYWFGSSRSMTRPEPPHAPDSPATPAAPVALPEREKAA